MKKLQKFSATLLLIGTLSLSTLAGQIEIGSPQPVPTPTAVKGEMTTGVDGNIHTGNSDEAAAGDAVVEAALSLVQVVLSLL